MNEIKLSQLSESNFVVYGTGFVSSRFNMVIEKHGWYNNLIGYAVTENKNGDRLFNGKKVEQIESYSRDTLIVIAVHVSLFEEIKKHLEELGFLNYIWIYPVLFDLNFGTPLEKNIMLDVKEVVANLDSGYHYAIYYLVIENYFKKNDVGDALYLRFMSTYSNNETAYARLERFHTLIAECEKNGFHQDYNIKLIDDRRKILDGQHRLMLAHYFGAKDICCDLYKGGEKEFLNYLTYSFLGNYNLEKYFSDEEIKLIKRKYNELSGKE